MTRRVYKNPPIVEAVCEFRFAKADWEVTWPGLFYPEIKTKYPEKPRQIQEQIFEAQQTGIGLRNVMKVQFLSKDQKRMVSLTPGSLTIHDMQPYSGWESFSERIVAALAAYQKVIGKQEITRIGIRYINHINLGSSTVIELDEYFSGLPQRTEGLPKDLTGFFLRVEFAYPDGVSARVTCTNQAEIKKQNPAELAIVLDIDVFSEIPGKKLTEAAKVKKLVMNLRDKERTIFESLITAKTRELFDV